MVKCIRRAADDGARAAFGDYRPEQVLRVVGWLVSDHTADATGQVFTAFDDTGQLM